MKKLMACLLLLVCALGAQAQFEKNKWFVDASATSLGLSYSGSSKVNFGFDANGGAFVMDNVALLLNLGGEYGKGMKDVTALGVGGRYYFDSVGVFLGAGLKYKHYAWKDWKDNDFAVGLEAGYAFFLSRTVTIEPAVFYDQSFVNHFDYSKLGFKLGFGLYF